MKTFRYDTSKNWYKGNTHLHSVASDGGMTFPEIEGCYLKTGHDFLVRTDHRVASDTAADDFESSILWINGVELDGNDDTGSYYHVVCIGNPVAQTKGMTLCEAMQRNRDNGALLVLAHPHWSGNSLEDVCRWNFHGVEAYNNVCHWLNGKGGGLVHWEAALMQNPDVLGIACDDAHLKPEHPVFNGGWIMVNSAERSSDQIVDSIRQGNFYSSCGPEIHSMSFHDNQLTATFSPVQYARLVGPATRGTRAPYLAPDETMTEFTFPVDSDWGFAYLEIIDSQGRRAWTNNLFSEQE